MNGLRIMREDETESNKYVGVFHHGKRFIYSNKETVDEREEKNILFWKRDPFTVLHITP